MKYECVLNGKLDKREIEKMLDTEISQHACLGIAANKQTRFQVEIEDQAQLRGFIVNIFSLNLSLVSIAQIPSPILKGDRNGKDS